MIDTIYLVEVDCIDPAAVALNTLRFSTGSSFMTGPKDVPPDTPYPARVISVGNFERHCWQRDTTRGRSTVGIGNTVIDNSDHILDRYKNFGFDGQQLRIYRGSPTASYPIGFKLMATLTMQAALFDQSTMTLLVRDRLAECYALPIQTALYGGTNALPNGFDGVAADLAGKPKVILLGACYNIPAVCVNTSKLTYQVGDRTNISIGTGVISAVYDKSNALTAGTQYASLALLQASTPSANSYNWCDDPTYGLFFQLGSQPAGQVTCDAREGTAASNTIAQIITRILEGPGGISADQILGAAALDSVASGQVGYWINTSITAIGDVIDALLATCNGFLTTSRAGYFQLGQLAAPSGPAVLTITEADGKDQQHPFVIIQGSDLGSDAPSVNGNTPSAAVPIWGVIMNYQMVEQVQTATDVVQAAGLARINFVAQQYRQAAYTQPNVLKVHALAPLVTFNGRYVNQSDALAEATRQQVMRGVHRDVVEADVDVGFAAPVELGSIVALAVARFDWETTTNQGNNEFAVTGKLFICIGMIEDYGNHDTAGKTTLVLWG